MAISDLSLICSLIVGAAAGWLIWRKWHYPRRWAEFGLCLLVAVLAILGDIHHGAVLLGLGDVFRLGIRPLVLGITLALMIAFLRTHKSPETKAPEAGA